MLLRAIFSRQRTVVRKGENMYNNELALLTNGELMLLYYMAQETQSKTIEKIKEEMNRREMYQ